MHWFEGVNTVLPHLLVSTLYAAGLYPPKVDGAIIMRVLPGTPAADAGLRRHDVVIEMRGRPVRTADEAKQVVDESNVGDILTLKVKRAQVR